MIQSYRNSPNNQYILIYFSLNQKRPQAHSIELKITTVWYTYTVS